MTENVTIEIPPCFGECIPEQTIAIRPRNKPWFDSVLCKTIRIRKRLRNKVLETKKIPIGPHIEGSEIQSRIRMNMRYQTTTIILKPTWKIQVKIIMFYWSLMKDSFNIKLSNEIPPIHRLNDWGIKRVAYSDFAKIGASDTYFSPISSNWMGVKPPQSPLPIPHFGHGLPGLDMLNCVQ